MNKNLVNANLANIEQNEYLQKLYSTIFKNYALKIFNSRRHQSTDFNLDDALRFADLLSKSAGQTNYDKHRIWDQQFPRSRVIESNYTGEDFLNKAYNSYTKEMLTVPDQDGQHFFTHKNVIDNLASSYFIYSGPTSIGKS